AMPLDDGADDVEPEAETAFLRIFPAGARELLEQEVLVPGFRSGALVIDPEVHAAFGAEAGREADRAAAWPELARIHQQVHCHLHQSLPVAPQHRQVRGKVEFELLVALPDQRLDEFARGFDHLGTIYVLLPYGELS